MEANSRKVVSNQAGCHQDLDKIVLKHKQSQFLKPVAEHSIDAFEQIITAIQFHNLPVIFDACCGVGDSTRNLAKQYPNYFVVGVDKSDFRLSKNRQENPDNMILVRSDLNDFYRLAAQHNFKAEQHKIYFPNPWPKSSHIGRRWHGAPVFSDLVKLSENIEVRSNWRIYLEEFQIALNHYGLASQIVEFKVENPITPFEKKYSNSGQQIFQLKTV